MIPTNLSFKIEWFSFASNLHDQKIIFQLKINTFIHANIIKEKNYLTIGIILLPGKFFKDINFIFFHIFSNLIPEKPPTALH